MEAQWPQSLSRGHSSTILSNNRVLGANHSKSCLYRGAGGSDERCEVTYLSGRNLEMPKWYRKTPLVGSNISK